MLSGGCFHKGAVNSIFFFIQKVGSGFSLLRLKTVYSGTSTAGIWFKVTYMLEISNCLLDVVLNIRKFRSAVSCTAYQPAAEL